MMKVAAAHDSDQNWEATIELASPGKGCKGVYFGDNRNQVWRLGRRDLFKLAKGDSGQCRIAFNFKIPKRARVRYKPRDVVANKPKQSEN